MTSARNYLPMIISARCGGRPVRWAADHESVGDFDGRSRTLEVFLADANDQLPLLRSLRGLREDLERAAGGPLVWLFHTRAESERLYGGFLRAWATEPRTMGIEPSRFVSFPAQDEAVVQGAATPHRRAA